MQNVRVTICLMIVLLVLFSEKVFGDTYFNDGGTYNIDYLVTHVHVDQDAPGMMTTVNLLNGGVYL